MILIRSYSHPKCSTDSVVRISAFGYTVCNNKHLYIVATISELKLNPLLEPQVITPAKGGGNQVKVRIYSLCVQLNKLGVGRESGGMGTGGMLE